MNTLQRCFLLTVLSLGIAACSGDPQPESSASPTPAVKHLTPDEVVVVCNSQLPDSVKVAEYYAKKRGIPKEHILRLKLGNRMGVDIGRTDFERSIRRPLRAFLGSLKGSGGIRCVVMTYGMPYRIRNSRYDDPGHVKRGKYQQYYDTALTEFEHIWSRVKALEADPSGIDISKAPITKKLNEAGQTFNRALRMIGRMDAGVSQNSKLNNYLDYYCKMYGTDMTAQLCRQINADFMMTKYDIENSEELANLVPPRSYIPNLESDVPSEEYIALYQRRFGLSGLLLRLSADIAAFKGKETGAALDSELTMVNYDNYSLYKWQPNDLKGDVFNTASKTMLVSRLDGPTVDITCSLVDGAMIAEQIGLKGLACFDSRGYAAGTKPGFDTYDLDIVKTYRYFENAGWKCLLDRTEALFPMGKCPNTAIYCGWYSLKNYKPAFTFVPGAVGYHIASWEAVDMRNVLSKQWVPCLLNDGITATIGAVAEPYLQSFPLPSEFFPAFVEGYSLAEAYYNSLPYNSWYQMLIGDPLYRPFPDMDSGK